MALTFWTSFNNSIVTNSYTHGAGEYPVGIEYLLNANETTRLHSPGGDWGSDQVLDYTRNWEDGVNNSLVSGSEIDGVEGRMLLTLEHVAASGNTAEIIKFESTDNVNNIEIDYYTDAPGLRVNWGVDSGNTYATVGASVGTRVAVPAGAFCLEMRWDATQAIAADKCQVRLWEFGNAPGSWITADSTAGTVETGSEITELRAGSPNNIVCGFYVGKVIVSDSFDEDLSGYEDTADYPAGGITIDDMDFISSGNQIFLPVVNGIVQTVTVTSIIGGENLSGLDYIVFDGQDLETMTKLKSGSGETTDANGDLIIDLNGVSVNNGDPLLIIIGDWTATPISTNKAAVCYANAVVG